METNELIIELEQRMLKLYPDAYYIYATIKALGNKPKESSSRNKEVSIHKDVLNLVKEKKKPITVPEIFDILKKDGIETTKMRVTYSVNKLTQDGWFKKNTNGKDVTFLYIDK